MRVTDVADRPEPSKPRWTSASDISPVLIPLRYSQGTRSSIGLGLPQVRREDLAGEAEPHAVLVDAAVVHPRLLHLDRAHARQDRPRRLVAVADHQPMAGFVAAARGGR